MNYASIEFDILNSIAEGYEDFDSMDKQSRGYMAGMLASNQDIETQLEIIIEAIGDNAEIPGPIYSYMTINSPHPKPHRAMCMITDDITRYLTEGLTEEYARLYAKYHSPEEVACREADEEDAVL